MFGYKKLTVSVAGVLAVLVGFFQIPVVQTAVGGFLGAHATVASIVAGIGTVIALFHNPTATT
ncbi:MAG: hypothetical protein WAM96_06925 [Candidatus Acidiferrales bacterium]